MKLRTGGAATGGVATGGLTTGAASRPVLNIARRPARYLDAYPVPANSVPATPGPATPGPANPGPACPVSSCRSPERRFAARAPSSSSARPPRPPLEGIAPRRPVPRVFARAAVLPMTARRCPIGSRLADGARFAMTLTRPALPHASQQRPARSVGIFVKRATRAGDPREPSRWRVAALPGAFGLVTFDEGGRRSQSRVRSDPSTNGRSGRARRHSRRCLVSSPNRSPTGMGGTAGGWDATAECACDRV